MKLLSIIPDIGPGGLTGAVLNRLSLLAESGEDASIVLYQFMPNLQQEIESKKQQGTLSPRVQIHNPYDYFDKYFSAKGGYSPESVNFPYQHVSHNSEEIVESYFDESLHLQAKVYRSLEARRLSRIQFFDDSSTLRKEEVYFGQKTPSIVRSFAGGKLANERYLSRNGFCYLRQDVNVSNGKFTGFWSWSKTGEVKFYKSIWDWRRDFVKNVVCAGSNENIILCDGNNVPPQFLRLKSRRFKVISVIHMNHRETDGTIRRHYASYFDRINEFDGIVCLTNEQAADIMKEFNIETPLYVIPNRIKALSPVEQAAQSRDYDVVLVSRLEPGKGVIDAVKAFRIVADRLPDAELSIFGSGSELGQVENAISKYGLMRNVKLRGTTNRPLQEMARAKVFLFTSESEGFGMTIAESLSSGTPVVSFDCKYGPASLVIHDEVGYLVQERDSEKLAGYVVRLLEDNELREKFSKLASKSFIERLSDEAILERWKNLLITAENN